MNNVYQSIGKPKCPFLSIQHILGAQVCIFVYLVVSKMEKLDPLGNYLIASKRSLKSWYGVFHFKEILSLWIIYTLNSIKSHLFNKHLPQRHLSALEKLHFKILICLTRAVYIIASHKCSIHICKSFVLWFVIHFLKCLRCYEYFLTLRAC